MLIALFMVASVSIVLLIPKFFPVLSNKNGERRSVDKVKIHRSPCFGWNSKEGCGTVVEKDVQEIKLPITNKDEALNLVQQLYPEFRDLNKSLNYSECSNEIPYNPTVPENKCWWFDDNGGVCGPHYIFVLVPVNGDVYELGFVEEHCVLR